MYTRAKPPCREEHHHNKSRKSQKDIPSFSSTLLDEIYRSFDGENTDGCKKPFKKQSISSRAKSSVEDEETASFRRARLVEKWMEKEASEKLLGKASSPFLPEFDNKKLLQDSDVLFFSSTSSSSDSSGALSSSDTEFFSPKTTSKPPKVSCFSGKRPKPVRTSAKSDPREVFDYTNNHQKNKEDDDLIKSRSRVLKIYANLKKVKQPISPGMRLTSFINSLFNNNGNNAKKSKSSLDLRSPKAASTTSACSSASSFSRSCLSKYSPRSREKMRSSNGTQRTVRFHPVSVIVDEDSRPCGHKCTYDDDDDRGVGNKCERRKPPLPPNALAELKLSKSARRIEEAAQNVSRECYDHPRFGDDYEDDDECDGMSDSSSDLFELDHLALFGNNRFQEELPVYETTNLDINRAIASGLIR